MPALTTTAIIVVKKVVIKAVTDLIFRPQDTLSKWVKYAAYIATPLLILPVVIITLSSSVPAFVFGQSATNNDISDKIKAYVRMEKRIYDYANSIANKKANDAEAQARIEFQASIATPTPAATSKGSTFPKPTGTPAPTLTVVKDIQVVTPTWRVLLAVATAYAGQDFTDSDAIEKYIESLVKSRITYDLEQTDVKSGNGDVTLTITVETSCDSTESMARASKPLDARITADDRSALAEGFYQTLCFFDENGNQLEASYFSLGVDVDFPIITRPGCVAMPYYNQGDPAFNVRDGKPIIMYPPDRTIKTSGCGPTSMAMIIAGLTGDKKVNPLTTFNYAVEHGYYKGDGTYPSFFLAIGKEYGISVQGWRPTSQKIIDALEAGHPIVAHMGPSTFTGGGHFIVLKGISTDGKIIVNDPGSRSKTGQTWDIGIFVREAKGSFFECWLSK